MTSSINPFALLEDESAELAPQETQKVQKKLEKKSAPAPSAAVSATPIVGKTAPKKTIQKRAPKNTEKTEAFEEEPTHKEVEVAPKPRSNGREHDRRSAHPKSSAETKKDTSGKASWGDEVDAQLNATAGEEEVVEPEIVEPNPEDSYKSFAQYQAEKDAGKVAKEAAEVRKPNEGVDETKWKKMTALVKEDEVMFAGKSKKELSLKVKEKAAKTVVTITQTFAPPPREPRTDRPERPAKDARSGGKSAPRNFARDGAVPRAAKGGKGVNVMDQKAFPTLA